jgi:hypothetical protein
LFIFAIIIDARLDSYYFRHDIDYWYFITGCWLRWYY